MPSNAPPNGSGPEKAQPAPDVPYSQLFVGMTPQEWDDLLARAREIQRDEEDYRDRIRQRRREAGQG